METYDKVATSKANKTGGQLFVGGILAGIFIAFGGICSQMITAEGLPKALSALTFSVGLIMVILFGAELFTGNCLLFTARFDGTITTFDLVRNWILVYVGNLIGSVIFASSVCFINMPQMFNGNLQTVMVNAYTAKISLSIPVLLVKGILCNFLVCLAVWCAIHAKDIAGKAISAAIPVFVFVYCGFEHSIANMFFLPVAYFTGSIDTPWTAMTEQIAVVTIGNILGGLLLSGAIFIQTSADNTGKKPLK